MKIKVLEITVTQGQYMGEEGTGYQLLLPADTPHQGDISGLTSGHYQGNQIIIDAEIADGYTLYRNQMMGVSIANAQGSFVTDSVAEAIELGILTLA